MLTSGLRGAIEELIKDVPGITDKNNLCDHLRDKQARLDQAIREHRKAADPLYVKALPTFLQISIPTGPMALADWLHLPALTVGVLGGGCVAILAHGWWAKFKDEKAAVKAKPFQYLLSLEKQFGCNR